MAENKTRYICFLDVLGFSEIINSGGFEKFNKYIKIINRTIESIDINQQYIVFSDSIIIFSEDDNEQSFINLASIVSVISYEFLVNENLALRGSIAHGLVELLQEKTKTTLAGKPIIEAYKLEQSQNWIGVILARSVIARDPSLALKIFAINPANFSNTECVLDNLQLFISLYRYPRIPFKNDDVYEGLAIIPHKLSSTHPEHLVEDLAEYSTKLSNLVLLGREPSVQKKYQNTLDYIRLVKGVMPEISRSPYWRNRV
ncbi:MAG: hypothetical protein HY280_02315 [Nitrospinae bacterium]|nr:hypothetical protein [Nitrospinota bacterium]